MCCASQVHQRAAAHRAANGTPRARLIPFRIIKLKYIVFNMRHNNVFSSVSRAEISSDSAASHISNANRWLRVFIAALQRY